MIDKNIYIESYKKQLAKILSLQDRNPFSKTFGCFDRNYWHYKTKDFPSAMSQEFTFPLALAYSKNFPDNTFYKNENLYNWIVAGIENTISQSRFDGSLDDYYPYERALGASVFTTYALTESCMALGLENDKYNNYFILANEWMIQANESGMLTNHHAIQAMCHLNLYRLIKDKKYLKVADEKIEKIISMQDDEGWFLEYGGCSPSYLTVTIDFLSQIHLNRPSEKLKNAILKSIDFFYNIQHPDGTCGGDYGSRNTFFLHPNGFEIMSIYSTKAAEIANSYLNAKKKNLYPVQDDDYTFAHIFISNLNAYLNCNRKEFSNLNNKNSQKDFTYKSAGFKIVSKSEFWAIFNLKKAALGKIYLKNNLKFNYSGIVIKNNRNIYTNALQKSDTRIELKSNHITILNKFISYNQKVPNLYNYLFFRLFLMLFGRFEKVSIFTRKLLQKLLIYKKKTSNYFSTTSITFTENTFALKVVIEGKFDGSEKVYVPKNFVPVYTAMSEYFYKHDLNIENKKLFKKDNKYIFEIFFKV